MDETARMNRTLWNCSPVRRAFRLSAALLAFVAGVFCLSLGAVQANGPLVTREMAASKVARSIENIPSRISVPYPLNSQSFAIA